jgi:hypothetical protein
MARRALLRTKRRRPDLFARLEGFLGKKTGI